MVGGVVAALGGLYLYEKNKAAAAPALAPGSGGTVPVPPNTGGIYSSPALQGNPGTLSLAGADPTQLQTVAAWVAIQQEPPMIQMLANADPTEIAGMYNIIANNLWGDPSVTAFWNQLVNKYDPQHKYL